MRIVVAIVVALIVAGSVFADYKWRRWMAARRLERDTSADDRRTPDSRY